MGKIWVRNLEQRNEWVLRIQYYQNKDSLLLSAQNDSMHKLVIQSGENKFKINKLLNGMT